MTVYIVATISFYFIVLDVRVVKKRVNKEKIKSENCLMLEQGWATSGPGGPLSCRV